MSDTRRYDEQPDYESAEDAIDYWIQRAEAAEARADSEKARADRAVKALRSVWEALAASSNLLCAIRHETRPDAELCEQIRDNRDVLGPYDHWDDRAVILEQTGGERT